MTDTEENKPKKLTLGASRLSLSKPIDPLKLQQSFVTKHSGSNVAVEVKKSKTSLTLSRPQESGAKPSIPTDSGNAELNKRLNIFKKATEEAHLKSATAEVEEEEERVGALSIFGNKAKESEAGEVEAEVLPDPDALKQDKVQHHAKPGVVHKKPGEDFDEEEAGAQKKAADNKALVVKAKVEEPKKLRKSEILHMLDSDEGAPGKTRSLASIRRARDKEKRKMQVQVPQEKVYREVIVPDIITVGELAARMTERAADVIRELMKLGIIANANQDIDADTAELIIGTFGHTMKRASDSDVENVLHSTSDTPEALKPRAPVVTVMGHVDHGKTSLLDALKSTDAVAGEAGGITQHIGAYRVNLESGAAITFIDTPGHAAFTEMRTRGAKVTDIVVLVVAADDGIKAQTIEAISHAKAANVPIIVAINKMDKPGADIERVKSELLQHELVPEDFGGDIIVVPVSALKRTNLDKLEESILLLAEMLELKANPDAVASGTVVESKIDKGRGVIATVLVQRGTLRTGDLVVAGHAFGRIKLMTNYKGQSVDTATPSNPVEIIGLDVVPSAGDLINVVKTEKQARGIAEYRARKAKDLRASVAQRSSLEDLFSKASGDGFIKELPIIIKADVQGSIEAIVSSITKLSNAEVRLRVLHTAVGAISESDMTLALATGALVAGFNVRANSAAALMAAHNGTDMRYYSIIYNLIDDIKSIMSGMLSPIMREQYLGSVAIREVFNITKTGKVAGSYVTKGIIRRGAGVRLLRDDIVIHEGKLKTLKRFKDDVKEVRENYECGIAFENWEDIKAGDMVEVFEIIEEKQTL